MRAACYLAAHTCKQKSHILCTKNVGDVVVNSNNNNNNNNNCYFNYYSVLVH